MYNILITTFRGVAQLVARASGGRGAAGSSPVTPTSLSVCNVGYGHSIFCFTFGLGMRALFSVIDASNCEY